MQPCEMYPAKNTETAKAMGAKCTLMKNFNIPENRNLMKHRPALRTKQEARSANAETTRKECLLHQEFPTRSNQSKLAGQGKLGVTVLVQLGRRVVKKTAANNKSAKRGAEG